MLVFLGLTKNRPHDCTTANDCTAFTTALWQQTAHVHSVGWQHDRTL